jgi:hypothetical protein
MTPAFTFPANADKSPRQTEWQRSAFQGMTWKRAELVGAPTGKSNGFDVLDIDPDGFGWYAAKFTAFPTREGTRRHGEFICSSGMRPAFGVASARLRRGSM